MQRRRGPPSPAPLLPLPLLTHPPPPPPQAALANIIRYHVVPGTAYTLDQLTEGMELQTLLAGDKGKLKVHKGATQKKPVLLTTSGQKVPIYQYNLETEGGAQLFTIRGVLVRAVGGLRGLLARPARGCLLGARCWGPPRTCVRACVRRCLHALDACAHPPAPPGPPVSPQVPGDLPLPASNTTGNGTMA